jgi:L-asparaginase
MTRKLPRVLILYTGGTFGMDMQKRVLATPTLSAKSLKEKFLERVPELQGIAQCDVDILMNRDSSHIGAEEWILFANHIQKKFSQYDGFVLLHGTDTMPYTASALSFLLRPCLKPVVVTGAQRPLSALRTDARTNLISAVEIAAHGPRELLRQVTVFFGDQLFQGNRVRKISATDMAGFDSPHAAALAVAGTGIRYFESNRPFRRKGKKPTATGVSPTPRLAPVFSKRVMMVHLTPSFPADCLTQALLPELHGIVLVVFQSWTAPTHDSAFLNFLQAAKSRQVPIVIVTQGSTQAPGSELLLPNYAAGKELLSEGCFSAGTMTLECTYVKTALLLGQAQGLKKFALLWKKELAEEG